MAPPLSKESRSIANPFDEPEVLETPLDEGYWENRIAPLDPLYRQKAATMAQFTRDGLTSLENHEFSLNNPSTYTFQGSLRWNWKDFQNGSALDYSGPGGHIAGGLRFNLGASSRHAIFLRGYYDFQQLSGDNTEVWAHSLGAESTAQLGLIPDWLTLGPTLGLGWIHYQSEGAFLNADQREHALDTSGVRIELGGQTCVWGMKFCLGANWTMDAGLSTTNQGFHLQGVSATAGVDLMRFWDEPNPARILSETHKSVAALNQASDEQIQQMAANYSDRELLDHIGGLPKKRWKFTRNPDDFAKESFSSVDAAFSQLRKNLPQVLMFGEIHSLKNYRGTTCLQKFMRDVLPALHGEYTHLVIEHFPHDIPDEEFDRFLASGVWDSDVTPLLQAFLNRVSFETRQELVALLDTCKKLGIRVHGGGLDLVSYFREFPKENFELVRLTSQINEHTLPKVRHWVQQGERVLTYHGSAHNNLEKEYENDHVLSLIKFGDLLQKEFHVAEVDLIVPEAYLEGIRRLEWKTYSVPGVLRAYSQYVPESGKVTWVGRFTDSYALVFPLEK